jgi:hypothetical protein
MEHKLSSAALARAADAFLFHNKYNLYTIG